MPLNARTAPSGGGKQAGPMEAGAYPARLVQVIDLGLQPRSYAGEDKSPMNNISFTYEFVDEFLKEDNGEDIADKPRWLSESMPLYNIGADNAKSTERYKAFDPADVHNGDFGACIGVPVTVTLVENPGSGKNKGRIFNKITAVSPMRGKEAQRCAPLVNEPKVFDLDEPDVAMFLSFPKFIKEIITGNLNYAGSKLESALKNEPAKDKPADKPASDLAKELDDENPF